MVKLDRAGDLEHQQYKLIIDDKNILSINEVNVRVDAKNTPLTEVIIKITTDDFKFIYEEDELSGNSSSDEN